MPSASSGMTTVPALLSMDEAMVGFSDAARRRDISRAMPTGQGMQLPAAAAQYNNFLGGIDYADQWRPWIIWLVLCTLCASRQSALCAEADVHVLGTSTEHAFTAGGDRSGCVSCCSPYGSCMTRGADFGEPRWAVVANTVDPRLSFVARGHVLIGPILGSAWEAQGKRRKA